MAEKTPGRSRKTTKKAAKQPIPIDTPIGSSPTGTTSQPRSAAVYPDNTPAPRDYSEIEEEIRRRAYELYEERGRQDGLQDEDWTRAETEILSKHQREKSA